MKTRFLLLSGILALTTLLPAQAQEEAAAFMGRWALHLPGGAGWLEVHDRHGFVDASLLWYGGSVLPVASINISDGVLTVTRTYPVTRKTAEDGERRHTITNRLELKYNDGILSPTSPFWEPTVAEGGLNQVLPAHFSPFSAPFQPYFSAIW